MSRMLDPTAWSTKPLRDLVIRSLSSILAENGPMRPRTDKTKSISIMRRFLNISVLGILAAGCTNGDAAPDVQTAMVAAADASAVDRALPTVLVYKTPTCECCNGWVAHLKAAGFTVDARNVTDIMSVKRDAGVPVAMSSCHTALIDGYVVEGHVPAEQIKRLSAERPDITGIAVPGMPIGSPGMEGHSPQPYQVLSFGHDGNATVFAEIDPR